MGQFFFFFFFFFPWRLWFAVAVNEGKQLWKPSLAKNEEIVFALWNLCGLDDRTVLCFSSPQHKSKTFSLHLWPYLKGWFAAQNPWNISWRIHTCGRYKERNKKGLGESQAQLCTSLSYHGEWDACLFFCLYDYNSVLLFNSPFFLHISCHLNLNTPLILTPTSFCLFICDCK